MVNYRSFVCSVLDKIDMKKFKHVPGFQHPGFYLKGESPKTANKIEVLLTDAVGTNV